MLQSMESQLQRERQRRMEEEMRGKKEQERREEAEREKVMGLDINQDGEFCQEMMVMEDGGQEQGGKKRGGRVGEGAGYSLGWSGL